MKKPKIYKTNGPSLTVPYKAIIIEYENLEASGEFAVSGEEKSVIRTIFPEIITSKINFDAIKNIDSLLIEIMRAFIDIREPLGLRIELITDRKTTNKNHKLICLEYLYQEQVRPAINAAFGVTAHIKSDVKNLPLQNNSFINQVVNNSTLLSPKMALRAMLLGAERLQIPYYPIDAVGGLFSYGQGKNSMFFDFAASQLDSMIGATLQTDKTKTNKYLKLLGYSTTEQRVASSINECNEAVKQIGFPVVIKPLAASQGTGVTANILHHEQIAEAFNGAIKHSNGRVIVEKHVEGDAHRFTMSNDALVLGIACIYPPFVIGDGKNNILKLIEIENERRKTPEKNELTFKNIKLDETMRNNLRLIGMNEHSIPKKETRINLLHTSNASLGGEVTILDAEETHPDNIKMAIDVTRLFKLNCSGIDFITPDITRSHREVGAIIEVNCQPGVAEIAAIDILKGHFLNKNNGRIDSTLVVTNDDKFVQQVLNDKKVANLRIGWANSEKSTLDDEIIRTGQNDLYDNCRSLLVRPDCDAIVISMSSENIVKDGLPIDYFNSCVVDTTCDDDVTTNEVKVFLKNHIGQFTN